MTPEAIAAALRERDTELNPGLPAFDADGLASLGFAPLHDDLVAMVRCSDGFVVMDESLIRVWDVATIRAEQESEHQPPGYMAFADYLIFSEIYLCDPCDASRPVICRFDERVIAPSYGAFWATLVAGGYDLPSPEDR